MDRHPTMQGTQRKTCRMKSGILLSSVTMEYFLQLCLNSSGIDVVLFCGGVERQSGVRDKEHNTGCGNKAELF